LRIGDLEYVAGVFRTIGIPLHIAEAADLYFERLEGVRDPEKKRKIIGNTFIEVFRDKAKEIGINPADAYFAQGTLYPDVIESVPAFGGPTATIKSHHNVGGLPEELGFIKLIEPLKYLFKDEVREVGEQLAGSGYISVDRETWHDILRRHPFPGPSLAIRLPDQAVAREKIALLREVDALVAQELKTRWGKGGLGTRMYDDIWQAVVGLLDVKTVGVMGDERTHELTAVMRFVVSNDGMTASTYDFPPGALSGISAKVVNSVKGVNRVFTDHTPKPPGTIEFE
jgi:GMP synthase (glutamine-hydrolysing)